MSSSTGTADPFTAHDPRHEELLAEAALDDGPMLRDDGEALIAQLAGCELCRARAMRLVQDLMEVSGGGANTVRAVERVEAAMERAMGLVAEQDGERGGGGGRPEGGGAADPVPVRR